MGFRVFIGFVAIALAFSASVFGVYLAIPVVKRRRASNPASNEGIVRSLLGWRLRNGFKLLEKPCGLLLRIGKIKGLSNDVSLMLSTMGYPTTAVSILSTALGYTLALSLIVAATFGIIAGVLTAACVFVFCFAIVGSAKDKRMDAARDEVPDALESMAACFGSGYTLFQTFEQVASELKGPLSESFARSAHLLSMGEPASKALDELRTGTYASELAFVAVALDVQHQSGGAMRQVLEAARDTVKGELALRRSLRVQTAQAKLSARIVAVMPFILVTAFSLASPNFLMPFFTSLPGIALFAIAITMQLAGILLVRKALVVEGVS